MTTAPAIRGLTLLAATVAMLGAACNRADATNGDGGSAATVTAGGAGSTQGAGGSGTQGILQMTAGDSLLVRAADLGRIMGESSAPIWIVMISDFQCPYCKQFHDSTLAKVIDSYVKTGKARLAYLHLPLPQHTNARPAARASLCAGVQGKFWEYADAIFAVQSTLEVTPNAAPVFSRIAKDVGLDTSSYNSCIASPAIERMVQIDEQQAIQAGVQSTPSFVIGEFLVQGAAPWDQFRKAVDTALTVAREKGPNGTGR